MLYCLYAVIILVLRLFLIVAYDWRTNNGRNTRLPNGHCKYIDQFSYSILYIAHITKLSSKFVQFTIVFTVSLLFLVTS